MSWLKSQTGFSAVELVIVVAVVSLVGFAGYTFSNRQQPKTVSNSQVTEQSPTAADVPAAPEVVSADDLSKAEATLDSSDVDNDTDNAQLNNELAAF